MLAAIALSASLAQSAFHELDQMCARDSGRMWGVTLCGPTMFVDRQTREIVTNRMVPSTTLPKSIGIANTSVDWNS